MSEIIGYIKPLRQNEKSLSINKVELKTFCPSTYQDEYERVEKFDNQFKCYLIVNKV